MSLSGVPIVKHHSYVPTSTEISLIDQVADEVRREHNQLNDDSQFAHLVPVNLDDAPAIHIDDFSEVGGIEGRFDVRPLQDRARLRAAEGDTVISGCPETSGYEEYCDQVLGLGQVNWLRPEIPESSTQITSATWQSRQIRRSLIHAARSGGLKYVHPHMGTFAVWELADLLHKASRQPVHVIAPPPQLCRLVNNKVRFSQIAERLFGEDITPSTRSAWNRTALTAQVKELACECANLGIKLPDSSGSRGNIVLEGASLRDCSNNDIFAMLGQMLKSIQWDGQQRLLVDCWETNVLSSPSTQLWIPPAGDAAPVLEGIFDQQTTGVTQKFVGAQAAQLTEVLRDEIVAKSTILAHLFQKLGYVGRCSFDTIITGEDMNQGRLEIIECNGRWGGTSLPMTTMNRLQGNWAASPIVTATIDIPDLDQVSFVSLLDWFDDDLLRAATGSGSLVFFTPGRIKQESAIDVLVMGCSDESAGAKCETVTTRLRDLVSQELSRQTMHCEKDDLSLETGQHGPVIA